MTEYSRFFGGPAGSEPEYDQNDFSEVLKRLLDNGVLEEVADELVVTETDPVSLAVQVAAGEAWINGFWYQNTAALTKSLDAADPSNPRIDRIVLRLDTVTNFQITVEALTGTPAASPSPPALTQNSSTWEISLAQVYVDAGATYVEDSDITDERTFSKVPSNYVQEASIKDGAVTNSKINVTTDKINNLNADLLDGYDGSDIVTGWIPAGETWTYASADDPTFTFTISGDKTDKYSAGMKIKLTQTTVKYFIITKVAYSDPNTTITIYGGTDYDLADATITSPYYSTMKAPQGFPLNPDKWAVEVTDTTARSQSSPTADTWYNIGSISINIPIGCWVIKIKETIYITKSTNGAVRVFATLSNSNNAESNPEFTVFNTVKAATDGSQLSTDTSFFIENLLNLTSKDTYYLNHKTSESDIGMIQLQNDKAKLIIKAVCAYL